MKAQVLLTVVWFSVGPMTVQAKAPARIAFKVQSTENRTMWDFIGKQ